MTSTTPSALPVRRALRLLRIALVVLAVYLALVNVLLNTALLEPLLNRKPERFQMHWQRGWMLWPGQIHLNGVTLTGQARSTVWTIEARQAQGQLALWPLLRKELHFVRIDADTPRITLNRAEEALPAPPADGKGLRLIFADVQVDSPMQLRMGKLVLEGQAHAQASWHQQLRGGPFELLPSSLKLQQARVLHKDRSLMQDAVIEAQVQIDAHRRRDYPGFAMFEQLLAQVQVQADVSGLAVAVAEDLSTNTRLSPGSGRIEARLGFDHGDLQPDSSLQLRLPVSAMTFSGLEAAGDALVFLQTEGENLALELDLPPLPGLVQHASARLQLASRRLPLPPWSEQVERLSGEIDLDSKFSSLEAIKPLFRRLQDFELEGRGDLQGQVRLEAGRLAAGTRLDVREAEFGLTAYSHRFQGATHAHAEIEPGTGDESRFVANVVLDRFDLAPAGEPKAILGSGRDLHLDLSATGQMQTLADTLDLRLRFANANLPDLARFNRYLPPHGVRLLSGQGQIDADMRMQVAENRNGGQFLIRATQATLGMGEDLLLRGNLQVDARLAAADLSERQFRLPGTRITLQHVSLLRPETEQTQAWWGIAELTDGLMDFEQPMVLAANADVKLRDVGPLLAIFAQRHRFPAWIRRLIDAGEADATARIQRQDACLVVDDIEASNDRFEVEGRIRYCGDKPSGQLYARWGKLGVAVALENGQAQFHFKGARAWFREQPRYLPKP